MFKRTLEKCSGWHLFVILTIVSSIGYLAITYFTSTTETIATTSEESVVDTLNYARLWLYASIAYILFSFRFWDTVGPDEKGLRLFFGQPAGELDSGLPFIPLVLFTLEKHFITVQQKEFPAEPQNVYRGEMKERGELPEDMKPPIRVNFRPSITDDEAKFIFGDEYTTTDHQKNQDITFNANVPEDGLSLQRVTAEVYPVIRWRIKDITAFVRNIGSIEEVNRQIEDELFSVLTRICQKISIAQAQQNFQWINALLWLAVISRIQADKYGRSASWGIDVEGVFLKYIHLHHNLNGAIGEASEADFKGKATERAASAEQVRLTKEGAGTAEAIKAAERAKLKGRADGVEDLKNIGIDAQTAASLLVASDVSEGGNTVVVGPEGFTQLAGLAGIFKQKTQAPKGGDEPKEES